jgi:hypothetical protein
MARPKRARSNVVAFPLSRRVRPPRPPEWEIGLLTSQIWANLGEHEQGFIEGAIDSAVERLAVAWWAPTKGG